MNSEIHSTRLRPKLMSFDVFGTLISVRDSSYSAFERILADASAHHLDVKKFWEHWEHRNTSHYWGPYRLYREICELSLAETFEHFKVAADSRLIGRYFEAFPHFFLYDDVVRTLDQLSRRYRTALVVEPPPRLDLVPGVVQRQEPTHIQIGCAPSGNDTPKDIGDSSPVRPLSTSMTRVSRA